MNEEQLIKEYLTLKFRHNKVLQQMHKLTHKKNKNYKDRPRYLHYSMLASDIEGRLRKTKKELAKELVK